MLRSDEDASTGVSEEEADVKVKKVATTRPVNAAVRKWRRMVCGGVVTSQKKRQ